MLHQSQQVLKNVRQLGGVLIKILQFRINRYFCNGEVRVKLNVDLFLKIRWFSNDS